MSSNPPEPEKYSLDEMLDRLQSKSEESSASDSGELVTRADGTQAVKVRKRKRRSNQPHKETAQRDGRLRAIQVSAVVILLILLVLGVGGLVVYANSAPYRRGVVDKISQTTGAKTELSQFRVNPTASNVAQAELHWPADSLLKSALFSNLTSHALISGLLSKTIDLDEISAGSGRLLISSPTGPGPATSQPTGKPPFIFERLGISKTDVIVGNPIQPAFQILQAETSIYPKNISGRPAVRFFRGSIKAPGWPSFRMDRGLVELHGKEVEVVSLRLLHETDPTGNILLSGRFDPYATTQIQALDIKLEAFNLNGLSGPSFGRLIDMRVDSRDGQTPNQLSFSPAANPEGSLDVAFITSSSSPTRLLGFPFLGNLSHLLENRWLAEPLFDSGSTGVIHREKGSFRINELSLSSKGQIKITGDLALLPDDTLSGTLAVGVPEAVIVASSNERLKGIFTETREGHRWITLKISGTSGHPTDNLVQLYEGGAAKSATKAVDLFESLTAPK